MGGWGQLGFNQQVALGGLEFPPDSGELLTSADEAFGWHLAQRGAACQKPDGFYEIGLADPVAPTDQAQPGVQLQL